VEVVFWLKLKVPLQKAQSTVSWYVRRTWNPKFMVCRPLVQSQLLTPTMPSMRLLFTVRPPWQHCSAANEFTPHALGAFCPSKATSGRVLPFCTPPKLTFRLALS
jgi:hypothetical protein